MAEAGEIGRVEAAERLELVRRASVEAGAAFADRGLRHVARDRELRMGADQSEPLLARRGVDGRAHRPRQRLRRVELAALRHAHRLRHLGDAS